MPYITAERVKEIRNAIKKAFPGYKFSITREHTSGINICILESPLDLNNQGHTDMHTLSGRPVSIYNLCDDPNKDIWKKIYELAGGYSLKYNHDGDYGDIPDYYIWLQVGKWDRPYRKIKPATKIDFYLEDGAVLAVFPDFFDKENVYLAYSLNTGHTPAYANYIKGLKKASKSQAAPLLAHLKELGY